MGKHTITVACDRCQGKGVIWQTIVDDSVAAQRSQPCPSCLNQGHVEEQIVPLPSDEAFVYICATRYALNRQTYAGGIVIDALLRVAPRMEYTDRKLLEKEIADALFRDEVDKVHRVKWEGMVDTLCTLN